ncbi:MAG: hypothetical protein R2827_15985, partial [Bdellovibrionales bacterium]
YIEIVKGTNAKVADANSDPDGDRYTNIQEISMGLDPNFHNENIDASLLNKFKVSNNPPDLAAACPQGEWQMDVERIQSALTYEIKADVVDRWFTSQPLASQQVIVVSYRLTSQNQNQSEFQYFGGEFRLARTDSDDLTPLNGASKQLLTNQFFGPWRVLP